MGRRNGKRRKGGGRMRRGRKTEKEKEGEVLERRGYTVQNSWVKTFSNRLDT